MQRRKTLLCGISKGYENGKKAAAAEYRASILFQEGAAGEHRRMDNILEYLEGSARAFPDHKAFEDENCSCSFRELEAAAKKVGTALARYDCRDRPVPVLMEKSVSAIQVMMGVVYAGGFYVVLDAAQPAARLSTILAALDAKIMVVSRENISRAKELEFSGKLVAEDQLFAGEADESLLHQIRLAHIDTAPLYILFTSGSTGVPKGVVISHRSVIDFIDRFVPTFGFTNEDVIGNQAPWDFDVSVKDIYSGMKTGATVVLIPRKLFSFPMLLLDYLEERRITSLTWAVSALTIVSTLNGLSYKVPGAIRRIMFSGETMPVRHLNYWRSYYPDAMFVNLYGPTEITCNCTYYILDREFSIGEDIPIGKAFVNEKVFLLDEEDHPVTKPGMRGEICVSGTAVGLGYYRNPEQTRRAFVQNPLNDRYLETIYRSGDLGFYNERGELCFASRKDFQIKHMGHRIELGEIDAALEKVKEVQRSCCIFDEERRQILCFYQGEIDKKTLSRMLGTILPDYMIPNRFIQVEEMPLNKNGKTDRKKLMDSITKRRK